MTDTDHIKVVVRVRPLIHKEQQSGLDSRWMVKDENTIYQSDQQNQTYFFDHIYDRESSNWDVYGEAIAPIVDAAMNGYHGTLFAYGQSGSGKTFTMSGNKMNLGIIALTMNDIFNFIEQKPSHEFLMRASYMEIYNERIYDLLTKEDRNLKLQETPDHQINVVDLKEHLVNSCEQALNVIENGEAQRKFAETKQNDRSSRSHCIFRIIIESRLRDATDAPVKVSHLNFVDLAGSEKAGENSGDRFREGCSINKSLFCLSNVISKLSEGISNQFIGYRDSKLTRILQNALGGNSKTVIIATINPTTIEESHSTLRFATRAKSIKNKAHVNEVLSEAALLKRYRNEITRLQKMVEEMGVADIQSTNDDLRKQLEEKEQLIKQLSQQIVVSSVLVDSSAAQKKKARRETWAAPKLSRKSYHPTLFMPFDRSQITIREESAVDLDMESLSLPFANISVFHNDESKSKIFLRRSEEMALTEPLVKDDSFPSSPDSAQEELDRLTDVIQRMEQEHKEEVNKLQEHIKQLEFEAAMEKERQHEKDVDCQKSLSKEARQQEEINHLKEQLMQSLEENSFVKRQLSNAEEKNQRLTEETCHLCNKRFDFDLADWENLEAENASILAEIKRLTSGLQEKDKEIIELKKALAGQEPYIARLEQQLDAYVQSSSGQLGGMMGSSKRRSGIPVLVKSDTSKPAESAEDAKGVQSVKSTSGEEVCSSAMTCLENGTVQGTAAVTSDLAYSRAENQDDAGGIDDLQRTVPAIVMVDSSTMCVDEDYLDQATMTDKHLKSVPAVEMVDSSTMSVDKDYLDQATMTDEHLKSVPAVEMLDSSTMTDESDLLPLLDGQLPLVKGYQDQALMTDEQSVPSIEMVDSSTLTDETYLLYLPTCIVQSDPVLATSTDKLSVASTEMAIGSNESDHSRDSAKSVCKEREVLSESAPVSEAHGSLSVTPKREMSPVPTPQSAALNIRSLLSESFTYSPEKPASPCDVSLFEKALTPCPDASVEQASCTSISLSRFREEKVSDRTVFAKEEDAKNLATPMRQEVSMPVSSSSTKEATRLKRRSDGMVSAASSEELDSELELKLRQQEKEIEQILSENLLLKEVLSQANAESMRFKETIKAMEQADAERLEELTEVSKLRSLLNRRDMEVKRLESLIAQLREDLNQQALNSSSSFSTSFTEPRRKSLLLREREAEMWKLKEQLVQQAKQLEDAQQEKLTLQGMIMGVDPHDDSGDEVSEAHKAEPCSPSSSALSISLSLNCSQLNITGVEEEEQKTVEEQKPADEEETEDGRERVFVTAEELEVFQRMLLQKDAHIARLQNLLDEKDQEMDSIFEGRMLVSSEMIESHLQEAKNQKQEIEELRQQLQSQEQELNRLRAREELRKSSSNSLGEEGQFQEQLIMDKMALEDALQEKARELEKNQEHILELQAQLSEKRQLVNQFRQQNEDLTEALLQAQQELISSSQIQADLSENPLTKSNHLQSQSQYDECAEEVADESFEVSFKMNTTTPAVSTNQSSVCQRFHNLKPEEEENQVNYTAEIFNGQNEERANLSVQVEASSNDSDTVNILSDSATALRMETKEENVATLIEEKKLLEIKLLEAAMLLEEKTLLELRVKELLLLVEEKQAVITKLQKSDNGGLRLSSAEGVESVVPLDYECGSGDTATLLTKLDRLADIEHCLEQNIHQLELTKEEKAAFENRVHELEAKLKQMEAAEKSLENLSLQNVSHREQVNVEKMSAEVDISQALPQEKNMVADIDCENLQSENRALSLQVDLLSSKIESLQASLEAPSANTNDVELKALLSENSSLKQQVDNLMSAASIHQTQIVQNGEVELLLNEVNGLKSENSLLSERKIFLEKELEETNEEVSKLQVQLQKLTEERVELASKLEDVSGVLEQKQAELEEVSSELVWQTKSSEELQKRVEELETEVAEHKQEAEDLVQDLERAQKLQNDSEQMQRVIEETLENFKSRNAELELELQTTALERDEIELKQEAAHKEVDRLRVELKVSSDRLEGKLAALEMELRTAVDRKEVLEASLAHKESAQHMSRLLHDKLSAELKESQHEVMSLKEVLVQKEQSIKSLESDLTGLQKQKESLEADRAALLEKKAALKAERDKLAECQISLLAEKDDLVQSKTDLEAERDRLAQKLEAINLETNAAIRKHTEKLETMTQAVKAEKESKAALQEELAGNLQEIGHLKVEAQHLKAEAQQLKQQGESSSSKIMKLHSELEAAQCQCQHLTQRVLQAESRCRQAEQQHQEAIVCVQQLQLEKAETEKKLAAVRSQYKELQDELGEKIVSVEKLEKELDAAQSKAADCSGMKMVPLIEVRKEKFVLKNQIRHLTRELEEKKEGMRYLNLWNEELQEKLKKYENEEQEDKDEKIEMLQKDLKAKEVEIAGLNYKHSQEIGKIKKQLGNAEEMTNYKEQVINRLKGEIRRMRSEEVSFCAPAAPKAAAPAPEPVKMTGPDERVISSHSGIIDRYTVTLLEADKYKLQKELKKTQDRLKSRESELYLAKVALSKTKTGVSPAASSSAETLTSTASGDDDYVKTSVRQSLPVAKPQRDLASELQPHRRTIANTVAENRSPEVQRSPLIEQRLGTPVDGDTAAKKSSSVTRMPTLHDDGVPSTQRLQASNSGTSVDMKKERSFLPSAQDKENAPLDSEAPLLATGKTIVSLCQPGAIDTADSPLQIDPQFWKKPRIPPPVMRKPSSSLLAAKVKANMEGGPDQCKSQ